MDIPYYPCPDLSGPPEPPAKTWQMEWRQAELAERDDHLAMLGRLAEIAMTIAEAVGEKAAKTVEAGDIAAFAKISQVVRRAIALHAHLGRDHRLDSLRLLADRDRSCDEAQARHDTNKQDLIADMVAQAAREKFADGAEDAAAAVRQDVRTLLSDLGDYLDYLDKPVGETVARLCHDLGLDPEWCIQTDEGEWITRSPFAGAKISKYADPPPTVRRPAPEGIDPAPA